MGGENNSILELSFQMGETLLRNGAEISRVQETMERVAPVSYTHLDVYKRQALNKPRIFGFWDFLLVCGSEPQLASPPAFLGRTGPGGAFCGAFFCTGGHLLSP